MKTLQIILILSIISSCFTQDDECTTQFERILQQKCNSILTSTCRFTDNLNQRCLPKNTCESAQSRDSCIKTIPEDFHKKKCIWDTTEANPKCKEVDKECADYNNYVNSYQISGDVCSDLSAGNNAKHCVLISEGVCIAHYKECTNTNLGEESLCIGNIPLNQPVKRCKWTRGETAGSGTCSEEKRHCDNVPVTRYHDDKTVCPQLNYDTGKKCIYDVDLTVPICAQKFISCSGYFASGSPGQCNGQTPLNSNGNDYDYKYICKYITGTGGAADSCTAVPRTCEQYNGDDASVCISLTPTEQNKQNKRCVFDTANSRCKEEYTNCELYATNEIEKDRDGCEDLIMLEENKKCVYIPEDDKCETRQIYENCEAYQGDDRKICESIISPTTNSYCVLDKDSKCKDRVPYCSEIPDGNDKDCIYYAKPKDSNKRCAYNATITPTTTPTPTPTGPRCYEEYARCEDYLGNDTAICEGIRLYNGLTCEFDSGRCRSTNKNCEQALTEEECKLINVTGVSDKEKKVCDYVGTSCIENYKYCSDFRTVLISGISGTTAYSSAETTCTNIKPYDESGNNIDIYSKCIYESGVGCQRVPKDCRDAGSNPILCNLISPKIKDNSVKYCAFTGGSCKEQFKNCEDITGNFASFYDADYIKCVNNIIEGYITNECLVSTSTPKKCMKKNECYSFSEGSYAELCKSINPNCTYSPLLPSSSSSPSPSVCHKTTYNCANTKFYTENEQNEAICKSIEANVPHKICVLKEDKTGCEEIYRESPYSSGTSSSQDSNSSSGFITKGINIILALLCLIF